MSTHYFSEIDLMMFHSWCTVTTLIFSSLFLVEALENLGIQCVEDQSIRAEQADTNLTLAVEASRSSIKYFIAVRSSSAQYFCYVFLMNPFCESI